MTRVESQSSPKKGSQEQLPIQIIEEDHNVEITAGSPTLHEVSNLKTTMEKGCTSSIGKDATLAPIEQMEVALNIDGGRGGSVGRNSQH